MLTIFTRAHPFKHVHARSTKSGPGRKGQGRFLPLCPIVAALAVLFLLTGCAAPERRPSPLPSQPAPYKVGDNWYQPMTHARDFRQRGIASWYGEDFHGRRTSSGEIYNMYDMTAAHKTLPLGTYVKVRNLENEKSVVVRVNDRGPFIRGRIIDLSYTSAKKIGLVGPGTAPVEVIALGTPQKMMVRGKEKETYVPGNYYVGDFSIQVGAFKDESTAIRIKNELAQKYNDAFIVAYESDRGIFYRVRAAKCTTLDEARRYEKTLETDGFPDAIVVAQ
jgi:rare lipoprotein A